MGCACGGSNVSEKKKTDIDNYKVQERADEDKR